MLFYSSIEDLKVILRKGILKTNRYDVVFTLPPSMQEKWSTKYTDFLPLICNVPIPALSLDQVSDDIYAEPKKMVTGLKYEELEIDSYIDANGEVIEFWNDWIMSTVDLETRTASWYENYVCPVMQVYLHKKVQGVSFHNIYPSTKGELSLSYEDDNKIPLLKIRFTYEYMRDLKYDNGTAVNKRKGTIIGEVVSNILEGTSTDISDRIYTSIPVRKTFSNAFDWLKK